MENLCLQKVNDLSFHLKGTNYANWIRDFTNKLILLYAFFLLHVHSFTSIISNLLYVELLTYCFENS